MADANLKTAVDGSPGNPLPKDSGALREPGGTASNAAGTVSKPRSKLRLLSALIAAACLLFYAVPAMFLAWRTVSTDDAYINGHVTFVAPRVGGQVAEVLVDDNNRVRKGDILVRLDREPFEVQVNIAQSAVSVAEADLVTARAQVHSLQGQTRSLRFALDHAIEDVHNQVALLRSKVAATDSERASLSRAQADFDRASHSFQANATSKEEVDRRREALLVAQARLEQALQGAYQIRVSLGLPMKPESGSDLTQVPDDLDQTASSVRQAMGSLMQAAAQLGVTSSYSKTPKQLIEDFYKRDPEGKGDIDRIFAELLKDAPIVKQAEAKLAQVRSTLSQAELNLRYTDVIAEIDGVVTRRSVNPGNNVIAGQSVMAVRSVSEIWVDANFKETQLAELRIGQPVDIEVDMYGSHQSFNGRISGVTAGTGSTLALLPAENATGNFVKVVQRVPVRIDLLDYDPEKTPLFVGLSVTPRVFIREAPSGPNAGRVIQPFLAPQTATAGTAR